MRPALRFLIAAALVLAFLPTAQGVSYGTFGTKVTATSTDFNPVYTDLAATPSICGREVGAAGTTDDLFYLNLDGAGTVVAGFDIRLTTAESRTAGTMVSGGDTDSGLTFTGMACAASFEDNVGYVEADGLNGYTAGDEVVWSSNPVLDQGDIRLTTSTPQDGTAVVAGTFVLNTDSDVTVAADNDGLYPESATIVGKTNFDIFWFDANIDGVVNSGDSLFLGWNPGSTAAPASPNVNDIYLHPGAGGTFGTKVTRSSTDYLVEPELFGTAPVVGTVGTAGPCSPLFVHFADSLGVAAATLQVDDVVLYYNVAACSSPQPASSITAGTRVTTPTQFQGTALVGGTALATLVYFIDVNANLLLDATEPIYLHRNSALGGTVNAVPTTGPPIAGDLRLNAFTAGSSSFTAGTLVGSSDADISAFTAAMKTSAHADVHLTTKSWIPRMLDADGANENPLTAATLVKFVDVVAGGTYDKTGATDSAYLDGGSVVGQVDATDTLLHGPAAAVTTVLVASNDFKVSGGDATFDAARAESIYFSQDAFVNDEDVRIHLGTGVTLTDNAAPSCGADADCTDGGIHSGDLLQLTWCVTASNCFGRLQPNDLQLSPTLGTRTTTATGQDFVPTLSALPTTAAGRLLRQNLGDQSSALDDPFYLSTAAANTVSTSAVRITPYSTGGKAAGTFVLSSDTTELTAGATGVTPADTLIRFRDVDSIAGYTLNDHVYVDMSDPPVTGAATGALSRGDIRLTAPSGLTPGTFVDFGNSDLTAGTTWAAGAFTLMYFDDNLNAVFDNGDMLYAIPPSPASTSQPVLGAVYLAGPGGSTSSGSSGGGGGSTVVTTTSTSGTGSSSSSSSSSSSDSTTGSESTDSATDGPLSLAAINLRLQSSLDVEREDGQNVLTWEAQAGVMGYQVWSSESPFVLLATLDSSSSTSYTDANGGKDTQYLVTAYQGTPLTADQVNDGQVPGYSGVPEGKDADADGGGGGGKGWIPGPGLALLTLALAAAVLVARRKL